MLLEYLEYHILRGKDDSFKIGKTLSEPPHDPSSKIKPKLQQTYASKASSKDYLWGYTTVWNTEG